MVVLDRVELSSDDYKSPALTTELKHNIGRNLLRPMLLTNISCRMLALICTIQCSSRATYTTRMENNGSRRKFRLTRNGRLRTRLFNGVIGFHITFICRHKCFSFLSFEINSRRKFLLGLNQLIRLCRTNFYLVGIAVCAFSMAPALGNAPSSAVLAKNYFILL